MIVGICNITLLYYLIIVSMCRIMFLKPVSQRLIFEWSSDSTHSLDFSQRLTFCYQLNHTWRGDKVRQNLSTSMDSINKLRMVGRTKSPCKYCQWLQQHPLDTDDEFIFCSKPFLSKLKWLKSFKYPDLHILRINNLNFVRYMTYVKFSQIFITYRFIRDRFWMTYVYIYILNNKHIKNIN